MIEILGVIFAWWLVSFGFKRKDFAFTLIGGILVMCCGVFIWSIGILGYNNLISDSLGVSHFFLGFYIIVRGSIELLRKPDIPICDIKSLRRKDGKRKNR